jgi:hypothetical protein
VHWNKYSKEFIKTDLLWGFLHRVKVRCVTDISEEHAASIFKLELFFKMFNFNQLLPNLSARMLISTKNILSLLKSVQKMEATTSSERPAIQPTGTRCNTPPPPTGSILTINLT